MTTKNASVLHEMRWVAGFGLAGAVVSGVFLSGLPELGLLGPQEVGVLVGFVAGALTALYARRDT